MGFPRRPKATPTQKSSSEDSTSQSGTLSANSQRSSKRLRLAESLVFNGKFIKIFIVVAKLEPEQVRELTVLIESNGGKVVTKIEEATIIVSKTKEIKKIVTLDWLYDSVASGEQKPFDDTYLIHVPSPLDRRHLVGDEDAASVRSLSPAIPSSPVNVADRATPKASQDPEQSQTDQTVYPTQDTATWAVKRTTPPKWQNKRFACQRWHPLVCINQDLVMELKIIRDFHKMEGDERRQLSYSKAMAALKAYPYSIKSAKEAKGILGVGDKIAAQCGEFIKTGKIEAAELVKQSERQNILMEFTKIHGVGSSTARELYEKYHCRSIKDVEQYAHKLPSMGAQSILLVDEFDIKIPRSEVEQIARNVNSHIQTIIPGAVYTICGGYRRGKAESNDVDIIFSHPEQDQEKDALEKLLKRLKEQGEITEVLYLSMTDSKRDSSMQHFHTSHMDPLDKAFTVYKSPNSPVHRRVDIIMAPYRYYACAILGWTGSTTFERDLRLYADRVKGMKFDSGGLWYRATSEEVICKTEEEIFEVLDLEYIPPEWRNADV